MRISLKKYILPCYYSAWRNIGHHTFNVFKGGRNSGKSTFISIVIVILMMSMPVNALVVRKVANTIADSVFEQLREAISLLGVEEFWKVSKSPLGLTCLIYGNRIIFRGADDPVKIKSIKTHKYPISILWIEELAEFKDETDVNVIVNSVIRGVLPEGLFYQIFYSYNPPQSLQSWVNKTYNSPILPKDTFVHHSTVWDNPYNSEQLIQHINSVKEKNEKRYEWEFLGKAIGSGILPFDNLEFRTISDEEISRFDNFRQGADWGYAADPYAFVRWHYDITRRRIYAVDEHYGVQISNENSARWIIENGYYDVVTTEDSAEPKSIDEHGSYGVNCRPAEKGKGSVEYGEKWLRELDAIIIDPERTPHIAEEFSSIDYQHDRYGNIISRLEDSNNHTIDATRYAFEQDMGSTGRGTLLSSPTRRAARTSKPPSFGGGRRR